MQPSSRHHELQAALRSLDADWPPRQSITLMDLVAEARAVEWGLSADLLNAAHFLPWTIQVATRDNLPH